MTEYAQRELAREAPVVKPIDHRSTVEKYGFWIILIALFFFIAHHDVPRMDAATQTPIMNPATGEPFTDSVPFLDQFQLGLVLAAILGWYLFTKIINREAKKKPIKYVPFNAYKEKSELERRVLQEFGKQVEIETWIPQPAYGRLSAESPHTMHLIGVETTADGLRRPWSGSIGLLWRNFNRFEPNHYHIEDAMNERSGGRKYETGENIGGFVAPSPAPIRAVQRLPSQVSNPDDDETEETDEDEDE